MGIIYSLDQPIQDIAAILTVEQYQSYFALEIEPWGGGFHPSNHVLWHDLNHTIGRVITPVYGVAIVTAMQTVPANTQYRPAVAERLLFANELIRTLRVSRQELWDLLQLPAASRHLGQYTVDEVNHIIQPMNEFALRQFAWDLLGQLPKLLEHNGAAGNDYVVVKLNFHVLKDRLPHRPTGIGIKYVFENAWQWLNKAATDAEEAALDAATTEAAEALPEMNELRAALAQMVTYLLQVANTDVAKLVHDAVLMDGRNPDSAYYQLMFASELVDSSEIPR